MAKIFQVGIVRQVDRDKVRVEIARATSCGEKCAGCKVGCSGSGIIVQLGNSVNAHVGDIVKIEAEAGKVVGSAAFTYLLPIIMMVVSMVYGSRYAQKLYPEINTDFAGLLLGIAALVLFYFLLRTVGQRLALTGRNKPRIIEILNR